MCHDEKQLSATHARPHADGLLSLNITPLSSLDKRSEAATSIGIANKLGERNDF
jgi:hypothetical protein